VHLKVNHVSSRGVLNAGSFQVDSLMMVVAEPIVDTAADTATREKHRRRHVDCDGHAEWLSWWCQSLHVY